jgi:hypothetical protein
LFESQTVYLECFKLLSDEERDTLTADAVNPAAYIPDLVAGPAAVHSLLS